MGFAERLRSLLHGRNGLVSHETQSVASGFFLCRDGEEERPIIVDEVNHFYEDDYRSLDFVAKGVGKGEVIERGKKDGSFSAHRWDGGREEDKIAKGQPLYTASVSLSRHVVGFIVTFDSKAKTLHAPGVAIVYRGFVS